MNVLSALLPETGPSHLGGYTYLGDSTHPTVIVNSIMLSYESNKCSDFKINSEFHLYICKKINPRCLSWQKFHNKTKN